MRPEVLKRFVVESVAPHISSLGVARCTVYYQCPIVSVSISIASAPGFGFGFGSGLGLSRYRRRPFPVPLCLVLDVAIVVCSARLGLARLPPA